jgi:hypothetical protein
MSKDTISKTTWTLTVIRDYESGMTGEIEEAKFAYGRTSNEMSNECRYRLKLPTGLIHLLKRAKLSEEALETGFMIEMTGSPQKEDDWELCKFTISAMQPIPGIGVGPVRGLYAVEGSASVFEMVDLAPPFEQSRLPKQLWLRVSELPEPTLAWVLSQEFLKGGDTEQMSLHAWFDFGDAKPKQDDEDGEDTALPLPGPSSKSYVFRE